jgi:hypothetical protein
MKIRFAVISVGMLMCSTVQSWAVKDLNLPVNVMGPKDNSCGTWTMERTTGGNQALEYWVLGYLSGVNALGSNDADILANTDANAVWAWMDNYCHQHPLDKLPTAVGPLLHELGYSPK